MILIVPAILDKTPQDYAQHINELKNSVSFQKGWVHIDFADNKFVPNETIGPIVIGQYPIELKKEAHLMVSRPLDWIDGLKKAGFKRVVFHFESEDDPQKVIEEIKNAGMEAGIAINPETPIEKLVPFKDKIDQILVMGIVPGFQGQPFIPDTIKRIKDIKSKKWPVKLSIDGAVSDSNARDLIEAGVDQLVIGSFLLQSKNDSSLKGDIDENVEKIWEVIKS